MAVRQAHHEKELRHLHSDLKDAEKWDETVFTVEAHSFQELTGTPHLFCPSGVYSVLTSLSLGFNNQNEIDYHRVRVKLGVRVGLDEYLDECEYQIRVKAKVG